MNTLEHDLHTMFTQQAEAMEVPPVSTPGASVGYIHTARTAPGRRWMMAAAAVVLVVGGGLAFAYRQPTEPPMAGTVDTDTDTAIDLPAAPGTDAAPGTSGDPTGTNRPDAGGTGGTEAGTGATPATGTGPDTDPNANANGIAPNIGTGAPKAPPSTPTPDPTGDGDSEGSNNGGGGALPPICDDQDTTVKVGTNTDMLLGSVGTSYTIEFYLYGCGPIDAEGYAYEASVADPDMVTIVRATNGTVELRLIAEGITSVKMYVTDAAGNPVGSVVVPIDVRSSDQTDPGDKPGDPTDSGDIVCVVPLPPDGDDTADGATLPDGSVIGYEPCDKVIFDPDQHDEPGTSEPDIVEPDCELPIPDPVA